MKNIKIEKQVGEFNRFKLYYSSENAVKCTVKYTVSGEVKEDLVFLEAGDKVFTCLILGFLDGVRATGLCEISVDSYNNEVFEFELKKVETDIYDVPSHEDYKLKNDRYTLGIRLIWGGGINYIEDAHCNVEGLTNLINHFDTGRLIQQSYYGTHEPERYHSASFNNCSWGYNPVQGGDKYQNHSRLIDFSETENSVYIKSQPQDWSLDGMITSSYMENTYIVSGDVIRVSNRFIDFTGWEHPKNHQELPAFYTVSYLDVFAFYGGKKPWTDGELTFKDDLKFWGDPRYSADCRFPLAKENSEKWCAWINRNDDYGIGLFVPNVEHLYAGKYEYDGSKDPNAKSTNYVAPISAIHMKSFEPIEYEYLITAGSIAEIRKTFTENKDFATNSSFVE